MKSIFILLLGIIAVSNAEATRNETTRLYGVKITSLEVTGGTKFTLSPQFYYTKVDDNLKLIAQEQLMNSVGTYRRYYEQLESYPLFDLSLENVHYPLLDEIDMDWYLARGIEKMEKQHPEILKDSMYNVFTKEFNAANTVFAKKDVLIDRRFRYIRNYLHETKFIINMKDTISHNTELNKKFGFDLKAGIDTLDIKQIVAGDANVKAYLKHYLDQKVHLKFRFIEIEFDPGYMAKVDYHVGATKRIDAGNDQFAQTLKRCIDSDSSAINSGVAFLVLSGDFSRTKSAMDSLALALQTKFNIPKVDALKISASVGLIASRNFTENISVAFYEKSYFVRYLTALIVDELQFAKPENKAKFDQKFLN